MKIQHVRDSLSEIKNEDLIIIEELNKTIGELEIELNRKYTEFDAIEMNKSIMNNIMNIKGNRKSLIKFLSPIFELIVIILATLGIVTSSIMLSQLLILLGVGILGLSAHSIYVIHNEYLKVADKDESIANIIISALSNILDKKVNIENKLASCLQREEELSKEIKQLEEKFAQSRMQREQLKDEVSYIEGNLYGVDCLINKYAFKDIDNENSVVHFIEEKRECKKQLINPSLGY